MTPENLDRAANLLAEGRRHGPLVRALPTECRPTDEHQAYDIQNRLHAVLADSGAGPIAGRKIGCTTKVMQRFLSIDNPCAGGVLAPTAHREAGQFRHNDYRKVGVECEIAVSLCAPLCGTGTFSRDSVAPAVGAVMAAIEVVDDRYNDYHRLGAPTLIADDFFDAGCVLGPERPDWRDWDLTAIAGVMRINGDEVGRGVGGDIMGHPFEALAWLANMCAGRGETLPAKSFVLLGSVVETKWVNAGDVVQIEVDRLGRAEARF